MNRIGISIKFQTSVRKLEIIPNPKRPSSLEIIELAAFPKPEIALLAISPDQVNASVPGTPIRVTRNTTKTKREISPKAVPGNAELMRTISS